MVRLEDRLMCVLQPPIESLLGAESLPLPFEPFDYQLEGVAFLCPRRHAVVADEMGLGKTMQSITAVRVLVNQGQARRVLLVCPKPLLTNWRRELATWAPELSVGVIEGAPARRAWAWREGAAVLTLVGYETLVRDAAIAAESEPYDLVLLDESQRIKNPGSATSAAVRAIPRERSWALTGTPIENSVDDLVGIFEFVSPGLLRPGMTPRAIGSAVRDAVIRRTKDEVLTDLPPKLVHDAPIDLTPEQWAAYQRAEDEGVVELQALDAEEGPQLTIHHVFELVLRLKQICNFDPATGASAKLERLDADLEECVASGRKAIVFSQWVDTIERIASRLGRGATRYDTEQYHGRVPQGRRDAVLDRFKNDPDCPVLLMSYGAGGVGLNLQFAGYVFLFDRWWNPAVEDQAINRAHRIGAAGPVTVTRMLAMGTIEDRIDQVLNRKRELFDEVFQREIGPGSAGLSRDELLGLFPLKSPDAASRKSA